MSEQKNMYLPKDITIEINNTEYESNDYQVFPPGEYLVIVVDAEFKPNRKQNGDGVSLTMQIAAGTYQEDTLKTWININNPSDVAQNIGRKNLKNLGIAAGLEGAPDNLEKILNKPVHIKVSVDSKGANPRNNVDFLANATSGRTSVPMPTVTGSNSGKVGTPKDEKSPW